MGGKIITIVLCVLIGAWLIYNIIKMGKNVKEGRSIDGCNGQCSECHGGCGSSGKHFTRKQKKQARKNYETAMEKVREKQEAAAGLNDAGQTEYGQTDAEGGSSSDRQEADI